MNKFVIGVIAILVIATGVIIGLLKDPKSPGNQNGIKNRDKAVLIVLQPDVYVKNSEDTDFVTIEQEIDIATGSEIKTSSKGRAKIVYPNGTTTTLEEDTHITIDELDRSGNKSRINLFFGGIWSKVENIVGSDNFYEVQTDTVVASVRGTIFATELRAKILKVFSIEDAIEVKGFDRKTQRETKRGKISIKSGEKTVIELEEEDVPLQREDITNEDLLIPILRRNLQELNQEDIKSEVEILLRRIDPTIAPTRTPVPIVTRTLPPTETIKRTLEPTPEPTLEPTLESVSEPTPVPTLEPTPVPEPVIESVYPKTVTAGQKFTLNGSYFTVGRSISQIDSIRVGDSQVDFAIIDSFTIFVTTPAITGTHDITVISTKGTEQTLSQAVTIQ
jgi:hypothetical protein